MLNDEQLNRVVYLGVDLSESNDNTSVAIVSVDDDDNIRIEQLEKESEELREASHWRHWISAKIPPEDENETY